MAAGADHTCARKTDGTLWCWGGNSFGQLGDGTTVDKPLPVQVTALGASVVEVSVGYIHACARKADGTLWCWGENSMGELGNGTTCGDPNLGNCGESSPVLVAALGTSVVEVSAGGSHTCASKSDGTLWCWGLNWNGQLGDGTGESKLSPVQVTALGGAVVGMSAGERHTCARKADGTLWCWGSIPSGFADPPPCVLDPGVCGPTPAPIVTLGASVDAVSAGASHTCARKTDGTLWCWGSDPAIGIDDSGIGSLGNSTTPLQIAPLGASVVEVSVRGEHICARKADSTLWCCGNNLRGQLGDGTVLGKSSPVQVLPPCP